MSGPNSMAARAYQVTFLHLFEEAPFAAVVDELADVHPLRGAVPVIEVHRLRWPSCAAIRAGLILQFIDELLEPFSLHQRLLVIGRFVLPVVIALVASDAVLASPPVTRPALVVSMEVLFRQVSRALGTNHLPTIAGGWKGLRSLVQRSAK